MAPQLNCVVCNRLIGHQEGDTVIYDDDVSFRTGAAAYMCGSCASEYEDDEYADDEDEDFYEDEDYFEDLDDTIDIDMES